MILLSKTMLSHIFTTLFSDFALLLFIFTIFAVGGMFCPLKHVRKCIIDADVLKGLKDPILLTDSGDIVELPIAEEKSA